MKKYIKPVSIIYNVELNEMLCTSSISYGGTTSDNNVTTSEVCEERQFEDGSGIWGQSW